MSQLSTPASFLGRVGVDFEVSLTFVSFRWGSCPLFDGAGGSALCDHVFGVAAQSGDLLLEGLVVLLDGIGVAEASSSLARMFMNNPG
jgi:hypothetical protein